MDLLISLISGAAGAVILGGMLKNLSQGVPINAIAGVVGGGLGSQILGLFGAGSLAGAAGQIAGLDIGAILAQVAAGGVGGGIIMAVVGVIRNAVSK